MGFLSKPHAVTHLHRAMRRESLPALVTGVCKGDLQLTPPASASIRSSRGMCQLVPPQKPLTPLKKQGWLSVEYTVDGQVCNMAIGSRANELVVVYGEYCSAWREGHVDVAGEGIQLTASGLGHVFKPFLRKCGKCELALFGGEILPLKKKWERTVKTADGAESYVQLCPPAFFAGSTAEEFVVDHDVTAA
ncbi:hypothetical protein Q9233_004034 [Columba guinea]|nr:hypothetical protein Q9233_004034 [Columba guinea]